MYQVGAAVGANDGTCVGNIVGKIVGSCVVRLHTCSHQVQVLEAQDHHSDS